MTEELENWADLHGETKEEYLAAASEDVRRNCLKKESTSDLLEYFADMSEVREFIIDRIIEKNLDL
jgi:hypothetical protein